MSLFNEKAAPRVELVPSVVALVLSLAVTFVGAPITRPSILMRGVMEPDVRTRTSDASEPNSDEKTVCSLRRRLPSRMNSKPGAIMRLIHVPLSRPALGGAALLVFVDCLKELPATLLLRPLNTETLATLVYGAASRGAFEEGSLAALVIVLVGVWPVIRLVRSTETRPTASSLNGAAQRSAYAGTRTSIDGNVRVA